MTLNLILQLRKMSLNYGHEEGDASFLEHGVTTKAFTLVCQSQKHPKAAIYRWIDPGIFNTKSLVRTIRYSTTYIEMPKGLQD